MADNSSAMIANGRWGASINRMSREQQRQIALDDRPLTVVAAEYNLGINQVTRLRAMHRDVPFNARRTKYTAEKAATILTHFAAGNSWKDSCEAAGVATSTAHAWLDQNERFMDARARALIDWAKAKEAEISAIADDPNIDAKQKSVMIKSRQWLMERQLDEYRMKQGAAEKGGDTYNITYLQLLERAETQPKGAIIEGQTAKSLITKE